MARGSRYNTNRLVGPDKITQLEYIDIAKASMYTEAVIPVGASVALIAGGNTLAALGLEEGDIMRVRGGTAVTFIQFATSLPGVPGPSTIGNVIHVDINTSALIVIPPGFTHVRASGAITFELIKDD